VPLIFSSQKVLLVASYWFHRLVPPRREPTTIDWVVGPDELASMVFQIRQALPRGYSVCFTQDSAYDLDYDYRYRLESSVRRRTWRKLILGPLLLGRLMNQARGFLYVGATGFLLDSLDRREFEFRFLKAKGLKIGIYWGGSEIRSTKKMHELERSTGLPNISTYIGLITPYFETEAHERVQQDRARVGDAFADVMFDFPTDQMSYVTHHREPFFYLMPDDRFIDAAGKFEGLERVVVVHATTSPVIKGTPLVRAAVAKLREEGYDFEYLELMGVDNQTLLRELARSHIALNQFYGFTTTVFGIEAMAAGCAVLASSDGTIETNLPPHANDALLVTKHWQVYDNLKLLLDHPDRIMPLALAGQAWARRYATAASAGPLLNGILETVLSGNYDADARRSLTSEDVYAGR
jgi:hypothetical protein